MKSAQVRHKHGKDMKLHAENQCSCPHIKLNTPFPILALLKNKEDWPGKKSISSCVLHLGQQWPSPPHSISKQSSYHPGLCLLPGCTFHNLLGRFHLEGEVFQTGLTVAFLSWPRSSLPLDIPLLSFDLPHPILITTIIHKSQSHYQSCTIMLFKS